MSGSGSEPVGRALSVVFSGRLWVQAFTKRIGPGCGRGVQSPKMGLEVSGRCSESGTQALPRDRARKLRGYFWGRGHVVGRELLGTPQLGPSLGREGSGPELSRRLGSRLGEWTKSRWVPLRAGP